MLHVRSSVFLQRASWNAGDLKVAVRESRKANTPSQSCTLAPSVICVGRRGGAGWRGPGWVRLGRPGGCVCVHAWNGGGGWGRRA